MPVALVVVAVVVVVNCCSGIIVVVLVVGCNLTKGPSNPLQALDALPAGLHNYQNSYTTSYYTIPSVAIHFPQL